MLPTQGSHVAEALAGVAFAYLVGISLYIASTYGFARGDHEPRGVAATLREALREALVVGAVLPLLPLFYLYGRRMGGGNGRPVVLVHGYAQNRVDFLWLARALSQRGLGPVYGFNYWPLSHLTRSAAQLERFVQWVCDSEHCDAVDVVCHSMGGLVALEMLGRGGAAVRRLVTIGSPHAGISWPPLIPGASAEHLRAGAVHLRERRALELPSLSIFSTHDNVVHPAATSSLEVVGGRDLPVPDLGHVALLFDAGIADEIAAFLADAPPPS
jgi:triacylglycerol lipase